jgi:peroxiredoxin
MGKLGLTLAGLERLAFIVGCLSLSVYLLGRASAAPATAEARASEGPFAVGQQAPTLPGVSYQEAESTTMLFIQSRCRFCTESMGFYREISGLRNDGARIVAVSFEPRESFSKYLSDHGLVVDLMAQVSFADHGIAGTPTVLAVDRKGIVLGAWQGLMSTEQQSALLALTSTGRQPNAIERIWRHVTRYVRNG